MSTFVGLFVGFSVCMAIVFPTYLVAFTEKDFNYGQRAWLASWPILGFSMVLPFVFFKYQL